MIKSFKQFVSSLFEKKDGGYDFGCAMIYFDFPKMSEIHGMIEESDVYTDDSDRSYGLEDEPHTTLLYGLHSNEIPDEQVMEICKSKSYGTLILSNPSLFENEQYDVLKFDVSNPVLTEINSALSKLPHTTNFPDYHPHCTIAYIKSGMGKKYVEKLAGSTYEVNPNKIVYSKPDGSRVEETWN